MPSSIAKVFISGNSQAIRLPKEFRLDANNCLNSAPVKGRVRVIE